VNLVDMVLAAIVWTGIGVLVVVAAAQIFIVAKGGRAMVVAARRLSAAEDDAAMASPLTPPVSIVMPWYEDDTIERLGAVQSLRYPDVEIIVVSSDATVTARLRAEFGLVEIPVVLPNDLPKRVEVTAAAVPPDGSGLLVVEVRAPANPADLLNVGAGLARTGLLCVLRPGVVLADDTLLRLARPFRDRPRDTLAATTIARPIEAAVVRHDQAAGRRWPVEWTGRFRLVDQLRSAVMRHAAGLDNRAVTEAGGLLLIRREQVFEAGGFRPRLGAEDDDLRVRATRMQLQSAGRTRRVAAVPNAVTWRAAHDGEGEGRRPPGRRLALGGSIHLGVLAVAALVGLLGVGLDRLDWPLVALVGVIGVLVPAAISLAALAVDDLVFPKQGASSDLLASVAAALVEPFGLARAGPIRQSAQEAGAPTYQ
jgi:cellulose synthase/poly-beta-1,6-N-acetylglucosamine synthase-like glycosyltransferase